MSETIESLNPLFQIVHQKTGLDLKPYKEKFLRRRLAVRLRATHRRRLADYLPYLEREHDEMDKLILCFTIHVSTFYRNPTTFQAITERVFPELFSGSSSGQFKFWSVGCARGEEPYSLAIALREFLGSDLGSYDIQIQGTDVDERVLEEAKAGEFRQNQLTGLDPALTEKYFVGNGRYKLVPAIKNMVRFHRRDVLLDFHGGDSDFILCRNLMIYLERDSQEVILERFHRALRSGGFLVLGRAEVMVGPIREVFNVVDAKERIYRKTP